MIGMDRCKRIAMLNKRRGRREQGLILLDSKPVIIEALQLGLVQELFIDEDREDALDGLPRPAGVTLTNVRPDQLTRMANTQTPPGMVAVATPPAEGDRALLDRGKFRAVFLEGLSDPGNVGTIARCALAFGVDFLLVGKGTVEMLAPKTLRASAGALLRLPIIPFQRKELGVCGARVLRTVMMGGLPLSEIEATDRTVLWLGNEAHGVGDTPDGCDLQDISIALDPAVESLNVATAAAICLHALMEL